MKVTNLTQNCTAEFAKAIAVYARVSTARQEDEQTVQTQLVALREFAANGGYRIVQEYIDDGWSGDLLARPALDSLRQDVKQRRWDGVLIYDPDRLARRYSYQELVTDELREAGVEVIFVTMPAPKNSEDKILHGVRGLFAEYERAKIAERFRLGKLRKIKEGHILVSDPLYGYRYVAKQEGKHGFYEINAEEARVVRLIFNWIADEGFTLRKVVRRLHELGISPRKSARGVWSTSTLSKLLRNEAYIGEAHWGSSYAVVPENPSNKEKYRKNRKSSRRSRPKDEWYKVAVPAIVDIEVFERARARLQANAALCRRNRRNEYLLAGKMTCVCGNTRSGEGALHGKHLYYRCTSRVRCFPLPPSCQEKGLNARLADQLVWAELARLMSSPDRICSQAERWIKDRLNKPTRLVHDVEELGKEIAILKKQEERYHQAYASGVFSVEQLKDYVAPIRQKMAQLASRHEQSQQSRAELHESAVPSAAEIKRFAQRASAGLRTLSFDAKRAIVLNTVDRVVGTQQELQVYGRIPIDNHVELFPSHRDGVNTIRHEHQRGIPFALTLKLPPPRLERTIVSRDHRGRISRSVASPSALM